MFINTAYLNIETSSWSSIHWVSSKSIMMPHPIHAQCKVSSLFSKDYISETFVGTLNQVSLESFRRSSPPPKHLPIKTYKSYRAIFRTPGAILDWEEDSWLFLFNWKLLGRPFSSPQYWQGEKLIKVLHFQIYWKCLRPLSLSLQESSEIPNLKKLR